MLQGGPGPHRSSATAMLHQMLQHFPACHPCSNSNGLINSSAPFLLPRPSHIQIQLVDGRGRVRGSSAPGVFFPLGSTEMALLNARAAGMSLTPHHPFPPSGSPSPRALLASSHPLPCFLLERSGVLWGSRILPLEVAQSTSFSLALSLALAASSAAPKHRVQASPAPFSSVEVDYKAVSR